MIDYMTCTAFNRIDHKNTCECMKKIRMAKKVILEHIGSTCVSLTGIVGGNGSVF